MALETGGNLGPYEIAAPLGVGGMGAVYFGRDTRLDRDQSGERIIATLPDTQSQRSYFEIRVVTGWLDDVRRRLSEGKN